jgi:hypothetical protein
VDVSVALVSQLKAQDYADQAPTPAMLAGWTKTCAQLATAARNWQRITQRDLSAFNAVLGRSQITTVAAPRPALAAPLC